MIALALAIADEADVKRRLQRAEREGDTKIVAACRLELASRGAVAAVIDTIAAQRALTRR